MHQITRSNFQAAIEAGITATIGRTDLPPVAVRRLRRVGSDAKLIGFGMFEVNTANTGKPTPKCYCPMARAKLADINGKPLRKDVGFVAIQAFAAAFDDAVTAYIEEASPTVTPTYEGAARIVED